MANAPGQIITFYSYKGGTGRTMALANCASLIARRAPVGPEGRRARVLAIDWDLEAPGLHRYFFPFLVDKDLTSSTGLIDFVRGISTLKWKLTASAIDRRSRGRCEQTM